MLRPLKESDIEDLIDVFRANVPDYFESNEEEDLLHYLRKFPQNYVVWELDGKVFGGGGHSIHDDEGHISWFLVEPKMHGKGIGFRLVEHSINGILEKSEVSQIIVRTSQLVFQFFEKFGFQTEYIKKDYWGEGLDLVYMRKRVS